MDNRPALRLQYGCLKYNYGSYKNIFTIDRVWDLEDMVEVNTVGWHHPAAWYSFLNFFLGRLALSKHRLPILLFLLRKTGPELTSVPIFLHFICGTPTTAWLDKQCYICTRDPNWRTPGCRSGTCKLNCYTTEPALRLSLDSGLLSCTTPGCTIYKILCEWCLPELCQNVVLLDLPNLRTRRI